MNRFFILSGRDVPVFLVDENGDPGGFDTFEEARTSARSTPMSISLGYIIIEMNGSVVGEAQE